MHPRGPNYVEDELLAKFLDKQEHSRLAQIELENRANDLYIKSLEAEEKGYLDHQLLFQKQLEKVQKKTSKFES